MPIIAAIVAASLLAGAATGIGASDTWLRVAGSSTAALVLGTFAAWWMRRRTALLAGTIVGGIGVLALFAVHLRDLAFPVPARALQLAAVLTWIVVFLALFLKLCRVAQWGRSLFLGCLLVAPLLGAELLVQPPTRRETRWDAQLVSDGTSYRIAPGSTAHSYYDRNPREYFETAPSTPLSQSIENGPATWVIETHEGSEARLDAVSEEALRVTTQKLAQGPAWSVKLIRPQLAVERGATYVMTFEARAETERRISGALGQSRAPWDLLSRGETLELGRGWRKYDVTLTARDTDENARFFFDLGESPAWIEIRGVRFQETTAHAAKASRFAVSYRFNSLGLRGPDRKIPAPPGTFRILLLGDSFAMGLGVKEDDTIAAQLENRLNSSPPAGGGGTRFEVINGGVRGYTPREQRLSFESHLSRYAPQLVLVAVAHSDDQLSRRAVTSDSVLVRTATRLSNLAAALDTRKPPVLSPRETDRELHLLQQSCYRRGSVMGVLFFRMGADPSADRFFMLARRGLLGFSLPALDLGPALMKGSRSSRDLMVLPTDPRPNELAHRKAAEAVFEWIQQQGWLPSRSGSPGPAKVSGKRPQ